VVIEGRRWTPVGAVILLGALSCSATGSLRPEQLNRLDAYEAKARHNEREVETVTGRRLIFDPQATLLLDLPGQRVGGQFEAIRVRDSVFEGRTQDGRQIRAPLSEVQAVTLKQPQPGATVLLFLGAVAAAVGIVLWQIESGPEALP
jgi:hypothetical protein